MISWGTCDFSELEALRDNLNAQGREMNLDEFYRSCAKELAARLLRKVIKRTPVGKYGTKSVDFIANLPSKEVMFTTKSGKQVRFTAKARKKNVHFISHSSVVGGTLRNGWTGGKNDAATYINNIQVNKNGDNYKIEIINPIDYASYVEYGHRTRSHKGWVKGQFMLTISEKEIQQSAPAILEKKLKKYIEEVFNA